MARFSQSFLRAGKYCIGRDSAGKKLYRDFSDAELAEYTAGTTGMIAAGYKPAVFLEHKKANTPEGAPIQLSAEAEKELQLRNGVGWLDEAMIGGDGAALHTINVTDNAIAQKIREGSIKFTSPELRDEWTDGKGVTHKKVIAHVALTHKPRNPNQSEPVEALQFSLNDLQKKRKKKSVNGTVQFADDAEKPPAFEEKKDAEPPKEGEPKSEEKPANPDLPEGDEPDADAQQFEAMIALSREVLGLDFPADADPSTIVRDLVTALKTMKAMKAKDEAEESDDEADDDLAGAYEDSGVPMQFSLADATATTFENKLLAKAIKLEHAAVSGRLDKLVSSDRITTNMRERLVGNGGTLQFSADGEVTTTFTLPQIIDLLEQCTVEGQALDVTQLSADAEEVHPVENFMADGPANGKMTEAQIEAEAKAQTARHPSLYKS